MQTVQAITDLTKVHEKSSYELITLWIDKGFTLGLSSNAIQVMTILLRFYNPKKKYVFPTQQTVAERANTSVATVKRALTELINANLILKRRTQRGNIYGFTGALFELLNSSDCTVSIAQNEPCMNREQIREQNKEEQQHEEPEQPKAKTNVVVFSQKSSNRKHRTITLADVPDFIKQNKKVQNPCAYWASLSEEIREGLIQKHTKKLEKQKKREEIRQKQEEEKRQYYKDLYDTTKATNPRDCANWVEFGKKFGKIKD